VCLSDLLFNISNSDTYICLWLSKEQGFFGRVLGGDQGPTGTVDETGLDYNELDTGQVMALKERLTMGGVKGPT
jgi:hypothetical protein